MAEKPTDKQLAQFADVDAKSQAVVELTIKLMDGGIVPEDHQFSGNNANNAVAH